MNNNNDILNLFTQWNDALKTGEPKQVAALYEWDATLLPTISNQVRHNHQEIEDYFEQFLELEPQGEILESNIRRFGDIAINSGVYEFIFKDQSKAVARYTYVYKWNGESWKILEHHSSRMPET